MDKYEFTKGYNEPRASLAKACGTLHTDQKIFSGKQDKWVYSHCGNTTVVRNVENRISHCRNPWRQDRVKTYIKREIWPTFSRFQPSETHSLWSDVIKYQNLRDSLKFQGQQKYHAGPFELSMNVKKISHWTNAILFCQQLQRTFARFQMNQQQHMWLDPNEEARWWTVALGNLQRNIPYVWVWHSFVLIKWIAINISS